MLPEFEIRRRISPIADSSLASEAASDSWLMADELRGRAALVPPGRFGAAALRRRDLTDPALERPRMAFPEAQEVHRSGSNWEVGSGQVSPNQCPLWVKSGH